jgi:hypothetical protein
VHRLYFALAAATFAILLPTVSEAHQDVRQSDSLVRRDRVKELAFDPDKFFVSKFNQTPAITIAYTGDDYAWPVYSIAVWFGCREDAKKRPCNSRTARMVRAPASLDEERLRHRGSRLIGNLKGGQATTDLAMREQLDGAGLDWLEADLASCSAASALIEQAGSLNWVPDVIREHASGKPITIFLHADMVRLVLRERLFESTYEGRIAENSPGAWAVRFARSLEPCWRPASAPPPWRR